MKIFEYKDYEDYRKTQEKYNKQKIDFVWVTNATVKTVFDTYHGMPSSVLCHGTRNAAEQEFFQEYVSKETEVLGTEISETATNFPNTVQWDFMKENPEWVRKWDIVYSNSFDHCTDPTATLKVWLNQLSYRGRLFIEFSYDSFANSARESDPLEISHEEFKSCVFNAGGLLLQELNTWGQFRKIDDLRVVDGIVKNATITYVIQRLAL